MQIKLDKVNCIEVGDIVERQGDLCLVVVDTFRDFPYRLVNLTTNRVVNGYCNLGALEEDCLLHTKGKDLYLGVINNE